MRGRRWRLPRTRAEIVMAAGLALGATLLLFVAIRVTLAITRDFWVLVNTWVQP